MIPIPVPQRVKDARPWAKIVKMGPPQGVSDADCGTAEMQIDTDAQAIRGYAANSNYVYYKPDANELEYLRNGGVIEFCQVGNVVQPFSASIWPADTDRSPEVG